MGGVKNKKDGILFVDPFIIRKTSVTKILKDFLFGFRSYLRYRTKINKLQKRFGYEFTSLAKISKRLDRIINVSVFYATYRQKFSDEVLFSAKYLSHRIKNTNKTNEEKLEMAKELLRLYSSASLVVTSRIHCALPCLALETPVIFTHNSSLDETRENKGRFDGIVELFHCIRVKNYTLNMSEELENVIKEINKGVINLRNKDAYLPYREKLCTTVESFVKKYQKK